MCGWGSLRSSSTRRRHGSWSSVGTPLNAEPRRAWAKPQTFDFLGVTHICGKTRAGDYLLVRQTLRKRMAAKLRSVRDEIMRRRHLSIKKQGLWLQRVVGGYFNYHAMPTNFLGQGQPMAFRKVCCSTFISRSSPLPHWVPRLVSIMMPRRPS